MNNVLENKIKLAKIGLFGLTAAAALGATAVVNAETYTIAKGDTLSSIASAHNTTVDALVAENHIADANLIISGQTLTINEESASSTDTATAAVEAESVTEVSEASTSTSVEESIAQDQATETSTETAASQTAEVTTSPASEEGETAATETTESASATNTETVSDATASSTEEQASNESGTTETDTAVATSSLSAEDAAAKEEIAQHESGGSYTASNGQYYGRYQLTLSYLGGDTSIENQERTADNYVTSRYGSWSAALAFWKVNGWY